jgi:hypothetical protein
MTFSSCTFSVSLTVYYHMKFEPRSPFEPAQSSSGSHPQLGLSRSQPSRIFILPLNDSTRQGVAQSKSSCRHEMVAVATLPRALEEAVSSFYSSLSRSAGHGAVSPALLPISRTSRPIADAFMEDNNSKR